MNDERRRDRRDPRLEDIRETESGLAYTGALFRIDGSSDEQRGACLRMSAWLVLLIILTISSGLSDQAGAADAFYVITPYIGEVSSLFALTWSMSGVLFSARKAAVRGYVLDKAKGRIPGAARLLAIFASMGFLMSSVYLARGGFGESIALSLVYPILKAASAAAAEGFRRMFLGVGWVRAD